MSSSDRTQHLSAERIQAFLEGELPRQEQAAFEEHAHSCARCSAEVEAWGLVLAELSGLPRIEPSPGFAERVMASMNAPASSSVRLRDRLRDRVAAALLPTARDHGHLQPERLQDMIDGVLKGRRLTRAREHLAACSSCARELASWQRLIVDLESLPALEPAPGFQERVMSRVRVRKLGLLPRGAPSLAARIRDRARALVPSTRRGWAVVSGIAGAPAVAMAAMVYVLISHPLLTAGSLFSFVWWRASALVSGVVRAGLERVVDSVAVFQIWSVVEALSASPATLVMAGIAFSLATLAATWVLYRNLLPVHSSVQRGYAHA